MGYRTKNITDKIWRMRFKHPLHSMPGDNADLWAARKYAPNLMYWYVALDFDHGKCGRQFRKH